MADSKPLYLDDAYELRLESVSGALLYLEIGDEPVSGGGAGWTFRSPSGQQPRPSSTGRGITAPSVGDSWTPTVREYRRGKARLRASAWMIGTGATGRRALPEVPQPVAPETPAAPRRSALTIWPTMSARWSGRVPVHGPALLFTRVAKRVKMRSSGFTESALTLLAAHRIFTAE